MNIRPRFHPTMHLGLFDEEEERQGCGSFKSVSKRDTLGPVQDVHLGNLVQRYMSVAH